jgi:hypothetical protein
VGLEELEVEVVGHGEQPAHDPCEHKRPVLD